MDDAERADEGHPVRVEVGLVCGFAHQVPYSVVSQEKSPDFLLGQFRFPGAEDRACSSLVSLEFVEYELNRPPLMPLKRKSSLALRLPVRRY